MSIFIIGKIIWIIYKYKKGIRDWSGEFKLIIYLIYYLDNNNNNNNDNNNNTFYCLEDITILC